MANTKIRLLMTLAMTVLCFLCPTCKSQRRCSYPGIPSKGPLMSKPLINRIQSVKHNTAITYSCRVNYTLQGQKTIRCEDGRWIGRIPFCKGNDENIFQRFMNFVLLSLFKHLVHKYEKREVLCNNPGDIPFGNKNKEQTFYRAGVTVGYWCHTGYTRRGESTIKCTENGTWTKQPPKCIYCRSSLGMERSRMKLIPDGSIRGSTEKDRHHKAREGRLNGHRAWCSGRETTPYIEIDFGKPYRITSLATQGSAFDNRWVGWYAVRNSLGRSPLFTTYRENNREKMFVGNTDAGSIVKHELKKAIIARKIRFYPMKSGGFTNDHACMRVELYGCESF